MGVEVKIYHSYLLHRPEQITVSGVGARGIGSGKRAISRTQIKTRTKCPLSIRGKQVRNKETDKQIVQQTERRTDTKRERERVPYNTTVILE